MAFDSLPPEVVARIVDKFVAELAAQLAEKKVTLTLTPEARGWLADRGFDPKMGARPMARIIQAEVKKPLAEKILFGELHRRRRGRGRGGGGRHEAEAGRHARAHAARAGARHALGGRGPRTTPVEHHGMPALRLETPRGASAVVALHGAQLLSWKPALGEERLFLSARSEYAHGKAIRGGVPICFPQFGALGPLPRHGFVRTRAWRQAAERVVVSDPRVALEFEPDAALRALWPHRCRVGLAVRLGDDRLQLDLSVENTGGGPLAFTAALHGYFEVGDVEAASVEGLRGVEYRDAADGDAVRIERGDAVRIGGEVDRVYHSVPGVVVLREPQRALALRAEGFPDVVVWNPGARRCAALPDMAPDGWRRMICVEAGAIRAPVVVPGGGRWRGRQTLIELEQGGA